jgi:hypothetical protein
LDISTELAILSRVSQQQVTGEGELWVAGWGREESEIHGSALHGPTALARLQISAAICEFSTFYPLALGLPP